MAFRRLEFIGPRVKVCLLDEGYTPSGKDFPTLVDCLSIWTNVQRDGLGTIYVACDGCHLCHNWS